MPKKHFLPHPLKEKTTQEAYSRWLSRKAAAHVKRDRGRGHECTNSTYKNLIHQAVLECGGNDFYTGEPLDWSLLSTYSNEKSKAGRHSYKSGFALLPTVDHYEASSKQASFRICAWRTNDAKNDLTEDNFIELCRRVVAHADKQQGGKV